MISLVSLICLAFVWLAEIRVQAQEAQEAPDEPGSLYARSAVLLDADSGRVLFGKEADVKRPMASTTKIMTCILTLENMSEEQTATVSERAAGQPKVHLGARPEEEYSVRDLLYSLMLESHNDSAVIIAEAIGGSVEGFAAMMNAKAEELGCTDTHFVTPNGLDGLDEGGVHSTTAADLARIMKYCVMDSPKKEEFLAITQTRSYQFSDVAGSRSFSCSNHNAFLDMMDGAISGKTGFTADAGYCYVGALQKDGKTFIVSLLACGWPNNKNYKWKDTRLLMEYGLANYEYRDVWEDVPVTEIPVEDGADERTPCEKGSRIAAGLEGERQEILVLLRQDEKVEVEKKLESSFDAPVAKGEKAGEVAYMLEGEKIAGYDIVTLGSVEERTIFWCFERMLEWTLC